MIKRSKEKKNKQKKESEDKSGKKQKKMKQREKIKEWKWREKSWKKTYSILTVSFIEYLLFGSNSFKNVFLLVTTLDFLSPALISILFCQGLDFCFVVPLSISFVTFLDFICHFVTLCLSWQTGLDEGNFE